MSRIDNDVLCDALSIESAYSSKLLQEKLYNIDRSSIDIDKSILSSFIIEIHSRIITIINDLELRSSKITIKIMRQEIENLKIFEKDIYESYPEYYL